MESRELLILSFHFFLNAMIATKTDSEKVWNLGKLSLTGSKLPASYILC